MNAESQLVTSGTRGLSSAFLCAKIDASLDETGWKKESEP